MSPAGRAWHSGPSMRRPRWRPAPQRRRWFGPGLIDEHQPSGTDPIPILGPLLRARRRHRDGQRIGGQGSARPLADHELHGRVDELHDQHRPSRHGSASSADQPAHGEILPAPLHRAIRGAGSATFFANGDDRHHGSGLGLHKPPMLVVAPYPLAAVLMPTSSTGPKPDRSRSGRL